MRFPVFALIAPIVTSLVLWMVTKSPYTLLFALMGPVMAVASFLDGRFGERRQHRLTMATQEIQRQSDEALHQRDGAQRRRELRHAHPAPGHFSFVDRRARPPWKSDLATAGTIRLGLTAFDAGEVGSPSDSGNGAHPARHDLVPLLAEANAGIVCVGNPLHSLSLARAVWMQLAWNVAPEVLLRHPTGYESDVLTHPNAWPISLVGAESAMAPAARYVIEILSPDEGRLSDRDDPRSGYTSFVPDYVTAAEAGAFAARLAAAARQVADSRPGSHLPTACLLGDVMEEGLSAEDARTTLLTNIGFGAEGVLGLDLVGHGPHAVVTGMTGTGKTEFLVSWMLSAALRYSPQEFTMVIIDFKGGAGFTRLSELPHCLGVMTDLDPTAAQRALHSLRAELRFRERTLTDAGVTDFRDLPPAVPLARLIIIVDEYRALLDRFSELQPLFLDIAARGRALGMHLILGTQRATGVLVDGILANCALRVVFRVNNLSDSMALLDTDAARTLPEIPGRAALRGTSLALTYVQVARATDADTQRVAENASRWLHAQPLFTPRRPWLPELPRTISLAELEGLTLETPPTPAGSLVLGLLDEPEEQRQSVAHYVPSRDGHVLVSGAQGSGRSNALALLVSQAQAQSESESQSEVLSQVLSHRVLRVGAHNAEEAWDLIVESPPTASGDGTLILIDDVEALVAQLTLEHRDVFIEALMALLRTGPSRSLFVVIATHGGGLFSSAWMGLMKSTLTLDVPAGRGQWKDHTVQLALAGRPAQQMSSAVRMPKVQWRPAHQYVVVSPRPRRLVVALTEFAETAEPAELKELEELEVLVEFTDVGRLSVNELEVSSSGAAQVFVGDVEDWQSHYALLAKLRSHATFIFDDCAPAEVRAVRRSRNVLPHTHRGVAVCVSPEGETTRIRLV